jgi:2'-5' RNA ligase
MRLFVAVTPAAEVLTALDAVVASLPRTAWRPVAPAQRHLTLRFLGETPSAAVPPLRAALGGALRAHGPFEVELRGLGTFPAGGRATVLWAGCGAGAEGLAQLAADVDAACAAVGWPRTGHTFTAHLTLARRRAGGSGDAGLAPVLRTWGDAGWGRWRVGAVALLASELRPQGPRYTEVARWPLAPG